MSGRATSGPGRPVRLLALDIDGTLLRSDKTLAERTQRALAGARARGVRLVLATGRRYPSALRVADQIAGRLPLIVHNGALIFEDDVVSRCTPLPTEAAQRTVRVGRDAGLQPVVHCGAAGEGLLLVDAASPCEGLVGYYLQRAGAQVRAVSDLEGALAEQPPIQVMFGGSRTEIEALVPRLASALGCHARLERTVYPASGLVLLDVIAPGVGKAEAVAFLQARWGVDAAETLAIGDNWNDREMIAAAGRGFLMGNADQELLALGLPTLPSNDEDGVASAIERLVLEN